ncbi:MAG TPA: hypothetical protein VHT75_13235 [Acidimicrobiales bacterium]|jgi:hypothetical protein|nr:hypothetical protein [Acidimicrobiales bacterium]
MIIAVLLLFTPAAGWWSYHFQRQAATLAHRGGSATAPMPAPGTPLPAPVGTPRAPAAVIQPVAVKQLERTSVLGWEAFTVGATLVLDGTLLLGCRRHDRLGPAEESTVVLEIGDSERADRAVALFQAWQAVGATLRLRPTTIAGAIEILDDHQRAVRAPLLLA